MANECAGSGARANRSGGERGRALLVACALLAGVLEGGRAGAAEGVGGGPTARGADALAAPPAPGAVVVALDDETRVRRADGEVARARGQTLPASGGAIELRGWRGETVAFQLVVVAGRVAVERTALWLPPLAGPTGVPLPVDLFREHYVPVRRRSRNDRHPAQSLGWLGGARPPDGDVLGDVPDALLPVAVDATPVMPGPAVPAGQTGTFWIDVAIPPTAPAGDYRGRGQLVGDGVALARFDVRVQVLAPSLPVAAASVIMYYEADRLDRRLGVSGTAPEGAPTPEKQLWRLLRAHGIDALAPLASGADVDRLRAVYDGGLFHEAAGAGPGAGTGRAPAVVALGTYGILGDPTTASLKRVDEMCARLPAGVADIFLYAIDETCRSPRAADWRRALREPRGGRRVQVAQTCDDPPREQPVDIAMVSAGSFTRSMAVPAAAREGVGPRTWIYNGILPRTGTLLLDADPRGLTANGWIAATMGIERWFYWESIFWDDGNAGGRGPVDPFVTAETFHNRDGDAALGDGLLLYPGRQQGPFAAHTLAVDGVLPSLRLKALRRGIEDAGIIALAAREHPDETARVIARAVPAALDEARDDRPASWEDAPLRFTAARAALRVLVTRPDPMSAAEVRAALVDLGARRTRLVPLAPRTDVRRLARLGDAARLGTRVVLVVIAAAAVVVAARRRRRRRL